MRGPFSGRFERQHRASSDGEPVRVPARERIAATAREVAAVPDWELVVPFGSAACGDGAPRDIDLGILFRPRPIW